MPLESMSSRASPHYALAPIHLIRRVSNVVAGRHKAAPSSGCHDRAGSAAELRAGVRNFQSRSSPGPRCGSSQH